MARQSAAPASAVAFLNPDTAISGLDANFEGTITRAVYERWDFKGKAKAKPDGKSGVVMAIHVTIDDRDDGGKAHDEFYPAGAIEDFVPSDDGYSFEAVSGKKGFFRDREAIQFVTEVLATGALKPSDLGIDPSVFEGKRFYWERKPPTWAKEGKNADGSATKASVLVPTKFVDAVGGRKSTAASKPKAAAAAGDEGNSDSDSEVLEWGLKLVKEALSDLPPKQKTISREDLGSEVLALMLQKYKKEIDKATRAEIGALFENDAFLSKNAGKKSWLYDAEDGEVTRVASA